ncbi:MAG TPA: hypothetical protein VJ123_03790 [Anaerolineales bacterium]|nr:hypothetical protein [Anaerolineales bacterium]
MIRHIWSVICSQSVIDSETNNISLLNILEQITVAGPLPTRDSPALIPIRFELVSLWERTPTDSPERGKFKVTIASPSQASISSFEADIDLSSHLRYRTRAKLNAFPAPEPGRYEFRVELHDHIKEEWCQVAHIPLDFLFEPTTQQPAP